MPAFDAEAADAYWRSAAVVAKGAEAFGRELASYSQRAVERNVAAATALSGVTSLAELWELQADLGRATVDSLLAESARLTEISISTAGEAFAPFQARTA